MRYITTMVARCISRCDILRDSVIGPRGRRMCLINCGVGSFCEANEIRMTLFLVFRGLFDVLSSPMARFRETPQMLGKNSPGEERCGRPMRMSGGRGR